MEQVIFIVLVWFHMKKGKCAAVAGSHKSKKPGAGPGAALGLALAVTEQVTSLHWNQAENVLFWPLEWISQIIEWQN